VRVLRDAVAVTDDVGEPVEDWPVQAATLRREPAAGPKARPQNRGRQLGAVVVALTVVMAVARLVAGGAADDTVEPSTGPDVPSEADVSVDGASSPEVPTTAVDLSSEPLLQLVDGEAIQLSSSGFRPDEIVAAVQCGEDPSVSEAATAESCDTGTQVLLKADGAGVVDAEFVVRRKLSLSGRVVDCSFGGCVIVATSTLGPTRAGSIALDLWTGLGGLDDPPRVVVHPASGIVDSAVLQVEAVGLDPGATYVAQQCVIGRADGTEICDPQSSPPVVTADNTGTATYNDRAGRFRYVNGEWLDCANPGPQQRCVVQLRPTAPAEAGVRQPGAFVLDFDNTIQPPIRLYSVSQASNLGAGTAVVFNAEGPLLQQGDPGVALCRVGITDACTALTRHDTAVTVSTTTTALTLPRRFTTWQGEIHDCVEVAPCELRFWMQDTVIYEYDLLVDFDVEAPTTPALVASLDIEGPYEEGDQVVAVVNTPGRVRVVQCVSGRHSACDERVTRDPDANALNGIEIVMHSMINTPQGAHDCSTEAACELRFIIDNGYVEPVPIKFDTASFVDRRIVVRPSSGHGHGTSAEIRADVDSPTRFVTSLCNAEAICVRLADLRLSEAEPAARIRLPRYFTDATKDTAATTLVDCRLFPCTLRIADRNQIVETPLRFDGSDLTDEPPEILIGDNLGLEERQTVPIRVSGFFLVDPSASNPATYRWCRAIDSDPSTCAPASVTDRALDPTGAAETILRLPEIEQTRATPGEEPVCATSCWLVATVAPAFRSASIQVSIARAN